MNDQLWLINKIESLVSQKNTKQVSEWAEENRLLDTSVTAMAGPWKNYVTPYLVEIMDCFSETSNIKKVAIQKASQVGFTTGVIENAIGYIIDHNPGPTMFITGDQTMAEQSIELKIDKMIESSNLKTKIFAQTETAHSKKTGDTKKKKEFPGGFLIPLGPKSPTKLRTISIQYLLFDEVDAYPEIAGKEGDPISLAERRTDAYETKRKIAYISTPLYDLTSKIKVLFEKGDQRKFYVPCKYCGHYQILEWQNIKFERDDDNNLIFDSVRYECVNCKKKWRNSDKIDFLIKGEWRATAKPKEPDFRSYHLNSLYSPIGMRSWESICQEWINIGADTQKRQVFVNTVLGETWIERGQAPSYEKVLSKRENYERGFINKNALILVAGADIQQDRIEIELIAYGKNKESWSINYYILYSPLENTDNIEDKCWADLDEILTKTYVFEDGRKQTISMCFIDAGYATNTVYQFCEKYQAGVYPVMGFTRNGPRKAKAIIKRDVSGYEVTRYDLLVDIFKDDLAACLRKDPPISGDKFPFGYCHFPKDYNETYFKQLTTEERFLKQDTRGNRFYVWENRKRRRNEALDCRVYGIASLHLFHEFLSADYEEDEGLPWAKFWALLEESAKKD